ncbi:alpha-amylase family glycosyl hydrolase [Altererythrobacter arenosus]|uniref:Alpha-amylase family glycosyl hydrolase n=1 Tax=Altererythrobacter arenosus TaxID=3032592 RepID=A0ABY8FN16_9SPHN|nr:alpha-amylase family glycosyl hydrolase [Altererythrobacter sp. CAU 1644]WFL76403.1 alpha-amylase family glycosyl hydrolase [Altererythrobacter sp. CAU 1644]
MTRFALPLIALGLAACATAQNSPAAPSSDVAEASFRSRAPAEEVVYFVLPDRFENGDPSNDKGGLKGGPLQTGFDPEHKGFFHGGDLKGLTQRLDYLERMGITAIWFAPIFQNKPVQGSPGQESAGYHGYWVTDFTRPDAHFGTRDEFKAFVEAAHARGMKVYMDIITNHTADVIGYKDGPATNYEYRSKGDYPYSTRGGPDGKPINPGFMGDEDSSAENFAKLVDPGYAYIPHVPAAEKDVKVPAWLNDPIYYHNRGNSSFTGEDSRFGDFSGLDDLFTEHPRVREGMIEIFGSWIDDFGIDGFRIDTARHVDPGFWQVFVPAMLERAKARGIPNFHMFGEVYKDVPQNGYIAEYTRRDKLPSVLDFAFQASMRELLGRDQGTVVLAHLFDGDVLYEGGEETALNLPTFLGNHDMGRFSTLIKADKPDISQQELLDRVLLGHAMMMVLRGSPVIYYGDEQGFVGDGHDQLAREDMFPSKTAVYNDNDLIGTDATTAASNFDERHPLFQLIAEFSEIRRAHPALSRGRQVTRHYEQEPGIFAVSRFDPATGGEYLLAFNTTAAPRNANIAIGYDARAFETLAGACPTRVSAPGSASVALAPFGWAVCRVSERAE